MEGAAGEQDFLNACAAVDTDLDPDNLLALAKRIEVELGRDLNAPRHSSRPLDIDLLLVADAPARKTGPGHPLHELTLPHPGILERRFVLEPLLEVDPPDRERFAGALERLGVQRVQKLPIIP